MSFLGQNLANLHIPSIGGIRKQFSKVSNPVVWRLLICKLSIIRPPSTLHSTAPFREIAKICGHVHVADSCCSNYSHRGDDTGHVAIRVAVHLVTVQAAVRVSAVREAAVRGTAVCGYAHRCRYNVRGFAVVMDLIFVDSLLLCIWYLWICCWLCCW